MRADTERADGWTESRGLSAQGVLPWPGSVGAQTAATTFYSTSQPRFSRSLEIYAGLHQQIIAPEQPLSRLKGHGDRLHNVGSPALVRDALVTKGHSSPSGRQLHETRVDVAEGGLLFVYVGPSPGRVKMIVRA